MAMHVVIMAGGRGERLWPISRAEKPKQLLSFDGYSSLIRGTVDRLLPLAGAGRVYVVTGRDIAPLIAGELPDIPRENILAEPIGRNTAPCIAFAAAWIARTDPQGIMAVFPSDHAIQDTSAFRRTVAFGAQCLAEHPELLTTIGIRPSYPETGYGYIALAEAIHSADDLDLYRVQAFHEKPDKSRAEEYIAQGCLWNAGMFMWRADTIMRAFECHMPNLYQDLQQLAASPWSGDDVLRFYQGAPAISIDYAIMEKAAHVAVIPASFEWNDVGSWDAVGTLLPTDLHENAVQGPAYLHESGRNVVWSTSKKIVLIGLDNLVVVEGEDAILVCPRAKAQDVSKVLKTIKD